MYLNGIVNEAKQRMTIETTSKENDYCKHSVNYFQSWYVVTTNKLLQIALWKRTYSSRQPEVAIVICHHTVYINGTPLLPNNYKKCSISNDLDGTKDDVLWAEQYDKSDTNSNEGDMFDDMMTHEQIQQMLSKESDDEEFWGFISILLITC